MRSAAHGLTYFCDDVRFEVNGKRTFVGVYGRNLVVEGETPVHLPLFSAVTSLIFPSEKTFKTIKFVLIKKIKEENIIIFENTHDDIKTSKSKGKFTHINTVIQIQNFEVDTNFTVLSRAYIDDLEVKLGALDVILEDSESNSKIQQELSE